MVLTLLTNEQREFRKVFLSRLWSVDLFLTLFLWYLTIETNAKRKLIFYKNLGISTLKLFGSIFIVDVLITVIFTLLIQEFRWY